MKKDDIMIVCLSGRGDKDVNTICGLSGRKRIFELGGVL